MSDLVGVETRLKQLCADHETLLYHARADTTDEGEYHLTIRRWDHPDHDGMQVVAIDYAYLTAGQGRDGWTKDGNGQKQRVPAGIDVVEWLREVGKMFIGSSNLLSDADTPEDVEPGSSDLTELEE